MYTWPVNSCANWSTQSIGAQCHSLSSFDYWLFSNEKIYLTFAHFHFFGSLSYKLSWVMTEKKDRPPRSHSYFLFLSKQLMFFSLFHFFSQLSQVHRWLNYLPTVTFPTSLFQCAVLSPARASKPGVIFRVRLLFCLSYAPTLYLYLSSCVCGPNVYSKCDCTVCVLLCAAL